MGHMLKKSVSLGAGGEAPVDVAIELFEQWHDHRDHQRQQDNWAALALGLQHKHLRMHKTELNSWR